MKSILEVANQMKLLATVCLFLLLLVPANSETLEGEVSRSSLKEGVGQQSGSGSAERDSLKGQNAKADTKQTQFELQAPVLSGQVDGGEAGVGVLGCKTGFTFFNSHSGIILEIFPGSDLLRLGIRPGDRIVTIDGHRTDRQTFRKDCRGAPGSTIDLVIERDRQQMEVQAVRKDARLFADYAHYFRKWAERTKYW